MFWSLTSTWIHSNRCDEFHDLRREPCAAACLEARNDIQATIRWGVVTCMANLIYSMFISLDGYTEDPGPLQSRAAYGHAVR